MFECDAKVVFHRQVNTNTFLMGLKSFEIADRAGPGQFVMIRIGAEKDPLLRRPFSIYRAEVDTFYILYRVVGRGTALMSGIGEGRTVSVLGPLGKGFEKPGDEGSPLFVGGGMGVAPLFFLAGTLRRGAFLMGFGTAGDVVRDEEYRGMLPDISIATDDGTAGRPGPVTELLEESLVRCRREKRATEVFTCGPAAMVKEVVRLAAHYQVPCQVSLEASMACGLGACQGCAVPASPGVKTAYWHVCKDGPVFRADLIDWERL